MFRVWLGRTVFAGIALGRVLADQAVDDFFRLRLDRYTQCDKFNIFSKFRNSVPLAPPHARRTRTGRSCGEANEIRKPHTRVAFHLYSAVTGPAQSIGELGHVAVRRHPFLPLAAFAEPDAPQFPVLRFVHVRVWQAGLAAACVCCGAGVEVLARPALHFRGAHGHPVRCRVERKSMCGRTGDSVGE